MDAANLAQQTISAVPDAIGFQRHKPAALLLIETTQEQVYLLMELLVGMHAPLLTVGTLAAMHRGYRHGKGKPHAETVGKNDNPFYR